MSLLLKKNKKCSNGRGAWKLGNITWSNLLDKDPSNIFLVHNRFKRIMLTNISQLKLGDIRRYHPSDTPQFSNLTISFCLKFNSRWERVSLLVTEEGKYLFVHKVQPENTQKKTPYAENSNSKFCIDSPEQTMSSTAKHRVKIFGQDRNLSLHSLIHSSLRHLWLCLLYKTVVIKAQSHEVILWNSCTQVNFFGLKRHIISLDLLQRFCS